MPVSKLLRRITLEYEKKGYPKKRAQRISKATVYGKIEKKRKKR